MVNEGNSNHEKQAEGFPEAEYGQIWTNLSENIRKIRIMQFFIIVPPFFFRALAEDAE